MFEYLKTLKFINSFLEIASQLHFISQALRALKIFCYYLWMSEWINEMKLYQCFLHHVISLYLENTLKIIYNNLYLEYFVSLYTGHHVSSSRVRTVFCINYV